MLGMGCMFFPRSWLANSSPPPRFLLRGSNSRAWWRHFNVDDLRGAGPRRATRSVRRRRAAPRGTEDAGMRERSASNLCSAISASGRAVDHVNPPRPAARQGLLTGLQPCPGRGAYARRPVRVRYQQLIRTHASALRAAERSVGAALPFVGPSARSYRLKTAIVT